MNDISFGANFVTSGQFYKTAKPLFPDMFLMLYKT